MNQIMALRGVSSGGARMGAGTAAPHRPDVPITVEIRALSACADIADAWHHLAGRALEPNPFFEPAFALAAAQHLVAFRDAIAILAWQGAAGDPQRRLVGLIPCFQRQSLFAADAVTGLFDRRVPNGTPLLDRQQTATVIDALLDPARQGPLGGQRLVLRAVDLDGPLALALAPVTRLRGPSPSGGVALAASSGPISGSREELLRRGRLTLAEPRSQSAQRDAVEIILAMEASGPRARAGVATLQDTREVGFLRAMTRGFGRVRQCRIGLLMLDDQPIAGAIVVGRGPRGWLYLGAEAAEQAAFAPQRLLLDMMQQAAPARAILLPGGLPVSGDGRVSLGDLQLSQGPPRAPRGLALRARDALRRSLFKLPRAGAA